MAETLVNILLQPVSCLVVIFMLPVILIGKALHGLVDLFGLASLIQSGDFWNVWNFLRSDSTDVRRRLILSERFPNSIAVRS